MPEKDEIFASKIKYDGIFPFADFYKFSYEWLTDQTDLTVKEDQYTEKIKGDAKDVEIKWTGFKKVTDYFKYQIKVSFRILNLKKVEVQQAGTKVSTNKGSVEVKVAGTLIKDYQGKFEETAFKKFLRSIYQKWIIPSRIDQFEDKLAGDCDQFLSQVKAYLDLEGKK